MNNGKNSRNTIKNSQIKGNPNWGIVYSVGKNSQNKERKEMH